MRMYQMRALFTMENDRVKSQPLDPSYCVTSFLKLQPINFFIPFISPFCFLLSPSRLAVGISFISKTATINYYFLQILGKAILMHHRGSHVLLNAPCIQSQERVPVP